MSEEVLDKIDVESLITQRVPEVEEVLSASSWFVDEEMTLDFGEYIGRPSENALMHTSLLTYFFANGWRVKEVKDKKTEGLWESSTESSSTSKGESKSSGGSDSFATGRVESSSSGASDDGGVSGGSETTSSGVATYDGSVQSESTSESTSKSGGAPYWCAYQTIVLTRRKMQSELVLNDMLKSFNKAYNEGRKINNERYDELVALYALMLSHTEDEANKIPLSSIKPEDLIALGDAIATEFEGENGIKIEEIRPIYDQALENIRAAIAAFNSAIEIPATWQKSREDEINRKFDAKEGQINAAMANNGTFASSAWANVLSGLERDRQLALTDLADSLVTLKVDTYGKIATLTADSEGKLMDAITKLIGVETSLVELKTRVADIRSKLMESATRVTEGIQKNQIGLTELRNTVLKWMFEFMERREDEYPGLEQLATIADKLGYSDGAVGGSISS